MEELAPCMKNFFYLSIIQKFSEIETGRWFIYPTKSASESQCWGGSCVCFLAGDGIPEAISYEMANNILT